MNNVVSTIRLDRDAPGELFIWTDVDAAFEDDFNRWYEREHMEERAEIPGFRWARRYRSSSEGRRYLALYRTESLNVFTSAAYKKAFEQQTDWSLTNFKRMTNTNRRVMAVSSWQVWVRGRPWLLLAWVLGKRTSRCRNGRGVQAKWTVFWRCAC